MIESNLLSCLLASQYPLCYEINVFRGQNHLAYHWHLKSITSKVFYWEKENFVHNSKISELIKFDMLLKKKFFIHDYINWI